MTRKTGDEAPSQDRKHIFISYAWEDSTFAEWLAKTLTREGYFVWIDRMKLLGGEPFPGDIEKAISQGTFRLLALMSHASLEKKNPRRERVLADKAGTAQKIQDFMIPIVVDDLSPNKFDFVTTELTALMFRENWSDGLKSLLKKLEKLNAPRDDSGPERLSKMLLTQESCTSQNGEFLTSNLFKLESIPKELLCYRPTKKLQYEVSDMEWPFYQTDTGMWAFSEPPPQFKDSLQLIKKVEWSKHAHTEGIVPRNVVVTIVSKALRNFCITKGLFYSVEDRSLKFQPGFLDLDKIKFINFTGRKSTVLVTSTRTSHYRHGQKVKFRYSIGPDFRVILDQFSMPVISMGIKLSVSDLNGHPLRPNTALGKRKKTARSWFNNHWLNRKMAILHWMTDGNTTDILISPSGNLSISPDFISFYSDTGIDETRLKPVDDIDPFDSDIAEDGEVE